MRRSVEMTNQAERGMPGTRRRIPSWAVLAVCCVAQFMVVLDVSIVNVALPQMRTDLGLTATGQQWVINAYTLTFAGFLMLGGRAADLFGRRRIFMLGLSIFTVCSLIGGLAQSGGWLIAARAAQGLGGAILAPATLSLLTSTFTDPNERRRALGAWSATAASGAAIGVFLGGVLTDVLDWRWVLFVNVPIGVVMLFAASIALSESKAPTERTSLDLPGAVTVTGGLAVLVYGIVSTDTHSWGSAQTVITLALGIALLLLFVLIEARFAAHPLIPLGIFRRRSLSTANGIAMTVGATIFGLYFFLSLYLQQVNGYSPLRGGLAVLPAGLSTLAGALVGSRIVVRLGFRRQLMTGCALTAIGLIWLAQTAAGSGYLPHVFGPEFFVGIGLGIMFVPMTLAATQGIPPQEAGLASGLINTSRQIGGAIGLAAMATVASSAASHHGPGQHAAAVALTRGYDRTFLIGAGIMIVGMALTLALPRKVQPAPGTSTEGGTEPATPMLAVES
jgi:EmrB/QacA subfamily drug resistance transporter